MIISLANPDLGFYATILGIILQKIEGKIFVPEQDSIEMPSDATITITFDDNKRGWWVTFDPGDS